MDYNYIYFTNDGYPVTIGVHATPPLNIVDIISKMGDELHEKNIVFMFEHKGRLCEVREIRYLQLDKFTFHVMYDENHGEWIKCTREDYIFAILIREMTRLYMRHCFDIHKALADLNTFNKVHRSIHDDGHVQKIYGRAIIETIREYGSEYDIFYLNNTWTIAHIL